MPTRRKGSHPSSRRKIATSVGARQSNSNQRLTPERPCVDIAIRSACSLRRPSALPLGYHVAVQYNITWLYPPRLRCDIMR